MIGERRAVDALIEGLKNSDENVRISCEKSLILIAKSNEKTFQRLIKELKTNRNRKIKENCADALGIIGDKRAVDVLIESLDDFYRFSREAEVTVINALGLIGDPKAVTPLIRILKRDIKKTSPNSQKKANKALVNIAKLDKVTFYLLISGLLPIGKNNTEDCIGILTENTDEKGSCFIKIICERSEECALEIGMEKTLATIKEYIGFIKDYYTKEELKEIQIRLYSFYRKTFEEESSSRIKMDLPKLEIKPPKRGPEICAKLLRVGS
jgi:HEAT repeat protein